MRFKTLTTVLHDFDSQADTLDAAIALAQLNDSHLEIICVGIDPTEPGFYYAGADLITVDRNLNIARESAVALEESVTARLSPETVSYEIHTVTLMASSLSSFLAGKAKVTDLVIASQPYRDNRTGVDVAIVEACLFAAHAPVLIIPDGFTGNMEFARAIVAWNEGVEALTATRSALPFLSRAKLTDIIIIDPPQHGQDRADPGGRLAQFLSRHGARAEISVVAKTEPSIASILCKRAQERGSDLIVMGAYGHSRLREAILGGATRQMLEISHVPVLMAH